MEKMENNKKMKKGIAGITLVALVVTIVVLLILAAISISMLTGENGILTQAQNAKDETELASIREELQIMWIEVQTETANKNLSKEEIAKYFEDKIKEKDPDATVKYNKQKNIYEISYKDHLFEIKAGNLTMDREEALDDVTNAWENVDKDIPKEEQADKIEEELQEKDPDSSAEYNPDTGKIEIDHGGENIEIDEDGNIEIVEPDEPENPDINIDTDGDGDPDINIDTDNDGEPDINIDTDGDKEPDINIDTDGDKEPDINIDTDDDKEPDINIDTDGDKEPDINIDTDGDKEPDINIDTDGDGEPDKNLDPDKDGVDIDKDGDGTPDINVDTDDDGDADINIDTDWDGEPDINIDTDDDKKPDINIDTDNDKEPDVNVDTDDDKEPDINIDINEDGKPEINIDDDDDGEPDKNIDPDNDGVDIDTDGDGEPDINVDTDDDGEADINIDTDWDGEPEINIDDDDDGEPDKNIDPDNDGVDIDTDGNGTPDVNVDTNEDGEADINIDINGDYIPDVNIDEDGNGTPDKNLDPDKDGVNIDIDGDGTPDLNVDTDDDGKADINIDTDWDGEADINIDLNGDKKPDINIDNNEDGKPETNLDPDKDGVDIDKDGDGTPDLNVDTNDDGKADINIDTDYDGNEDINIDTDGDKKPDINIDKNGDEIPDTNIDEDNDGEPDKNIDPDNDGVDIDSDGDGTPDISVDTDDDGEADINIDINGDGKPDINIDTDNDGEPEENLDPDKDGVDIDTDGDGEPDINVDTDDDGEANINIDTDWDGKPDINIDEDGDKEPDKNIDPDNDGVDIDTDGDGTPDLNVDTDDDGEADINIDTDNDKEPDINIDLNGDGKPDINIDNDNDGEPEENLDPDKDGVDIDKDGDGTPDINVDTDDDGKPDIDIDNDWDGKEDTNIDTDGDKKPDINIDLNGDGKPDINIDTDNDGEPEENLDPDKDGVDIDKDGDGTPDINVDTDGDGEADINIDINFDGKPDINIDNDEDGEPEINLDPDKDGVNIDTDGDGDPDINIDTDEDGKADINIDTDWDGEADINIDLNGDKKPDINIDNNEDGKPETNLDPDKDGVDIDKDGDVTPDLNVDTDDDGKADINIDTDFDGEENTNIDTDGDKEPDINIDLNEDGKPDINIDENGDGEPEINIDPDKDGVDIDTDGDGTPDLNVDTDEDGEADIDIDINLDGKPDINIDEDGDGEADKNLDPDKDGVNIDTDGNGEPDINVDTNGDGEADINIDTDWDGEADINIDLNGDGKPDINIDDNNDGEPDKNLDPDKDGINIDKDGDGTPDLNVDTDEDGKADINIDTDGDGKEDINIDTNEDGEADINIDLNEDGKPDINIDEDEDGIPDKNLNPDKDGVDIDKDGDGTPDLNVDTDEDGKADINIDTDFDGEADINIDLNGDKKPDINIDENGDNIPDKNLDPDKDGIDIDKDGDGTPDLNVDTDKDGQADLNVDTNGDNEPDIDMDTNGDGVADKNVTKLAIVGQPISIDTISNVNDVSFEVSVTGAFSVNAPGEEKITYQWYYNTTGSNEEGTQIVGANEATYTIPKDNVTASISGRYYYVKVTQEYRGKTNIEVSDVAKLTVISEVEITKQPTSVQTIEGQEDVSFTVEASGLGNVSYQWYYKTSSEGEEIQLSGENEATLTIPKEEVTKDLNGRYYFAKITQSYGMGVVSKNSNEALLTVAGRASIEKQPSDITITEGRTATFEVKVANEIGDITYQWYKNTENSSSGGEEIPGANGSSYEVEKVTASDNNTYYYCVITQEYGSSVYSTTSNAAKLTVGNGVSVSTLNDVNVIEGITDVTFTVTASGEGSFTYKWYKNTTASNEGGELIENANSNTYKIAKENVTTALNETYYYVEVTQSYGSSTETIKSNAARLSVIGKVTIDTNPSDVSTFENVGDVTFRVVAGGEGTKTYQWYKNTTNSNQGGEEIPGAVGDTYTIAKENVTTDLNNTYYYVVVTQKYGSSSTTVTSNAAKLEVKRTEIEASENNVTAYVGGESKKVTLSGENAGEFIIDTLADPSIALAEINPENNNELVITPVSKGETSVTIRELNGNKTTKINIEVLQTTIKAEPGSVLMYVGGQSKSVALSGDNTNEFVIETGPKDTVATANISGKILTINPVGVGTTSVVVKETNGNQKTTVNVEVKESTIDANNKNVTLYVGGSSQSVTITGENQGALSIAEGQQNNFVTPTLEGNILKLEPKASGETDIVVKEANGNKEVTIHVNVIATSIDASNKNVIAYVGGANQTVTITGTQAGAFSIQTPPDSTYAMASLSGSTLTITPKAQGKTSVVVKETNGNKTVTINIEVRKTTITATSTNVTAYVGGSNQTVTISGTYMGELSIEENTKEAIATVNLDKDSKTLTIKPVAAGTTSVTVKEANGNQKVTININVIRSTITASNTNVIAYVDGEDKTVTIQGDALGALSISKNPDTSVAEASLNTNNKTLTISPKASGTTSVIVKEANGNATVTINITVLLTSITGQNVETYVGGASKTITIEGQNMGTLSIEDGPDEAQATVSLDTNNNTLTINPKAAGTTSVILKEANGNKTATINISVLATSITASTESVTVYVGGGAKTVTLGGTNAGAFSIVTGPNTTYATAILNDKTLTITPKAQGDTSVVVKEANGNVQKTIKITVKEVSLGVNPTTSTVYLGGSSKTVQITGANYSALTVSSSDSNVATGSVSGTNLTIKPGSKAGTATITLKETNANKETKVTVTVRDSSIQASVAEVKAYVGGSAKTVTINGTYAGTLSVSTNTNSNVAGASVNTDTKKLTISPKAVGTTTITVKEANAGKTTSVKVTVEQTSINGQDVTLFVGGSSKTITITGSSNMGTLSIEDGPDTAKAKASLNTNNKTLTITPVAAGETTVKLKEANGNKIATINIEVLATSVTANPTSVTAYVDGGNKTVTIGGSNKGSLSLSGINTNIATASISGNTLTITPKAEGTTSVTITESNGKAKVTVSIKVLITTIKVEPTSVVAYVSGGNKTVHLSGTNAGAFSITSGGETDYYKASISDSTLTITPKAAGSGNVVVKEANGGKTVTIPVTVKSVTFGATNTNVTAYVGGGNQTVTITGTNHGSLSISTQPTSSIATASLSGTTLTITPKAAGTTKVVLKEGNAGKTVTVNITVKASSITASSTSVTAYVGGGNKTVTISGSNMGALSISTQPTSSVATASLNTSTKVLTITPKGSGTANIVVREANGKKTVTIKVTVLATSVTSQTVTVYAGGSAKTVTIQGQNMGNLNIITPPNGTYATATLSGTSLTITPKSTAGTTSLVLQESNGNKTAIINITVTGTSITASRTNVTAYVGGGDQTITIGGTNRGTLSISEHPNETYATASLSGTTLTIKPKSTAGSARVVLKEANGNKTVTINITVTRLTSTGTWNGKVNTPNLKSGMTPVYWDNSNNEITFTTTNFDINNWYNYDSNKWANAKTEDGSYWVWIPRYEYQVINNVTDASQAGTVNVNFIQTSDTSASSNYYIHPAFRNDKGNNYANGGWDEEIPGFWVAKFEMSMENSSGANVNTSSNSIGNVALSSNNKMVSKPGYISWRYINIANTYTNSYNYNRASESHLMKNSEWGAVAFLTHSQYGREGKEVTINSNGSYYTGGGTGTAYKANVLQSSTGTISGVYDLSGGVYEYVAAFNNAYSGTYFTGSSFLDVNGKHFASKGGASTKYATAYSNSTSTYSNDFTVGTVSIRGDAIQEVYVGSSDGWFNDTSLFVYKFYPLFTRGGYYYDGTSAGVFYSGGYNGGAISIYGFRVVLV